MSDNQVRNVSDLEKALEASFPRRNNSPLPQLQQDISQLSSPTESISAHTHNFALNDIRPNSPAINSKERTGTHQYSSNQLLINIAGLQTTTNTKLDLLTDSVLRLNKTMEGIVDEQRKHTELLARIMSNTAEPRMVQENSGTPTGKSNKQMVHKCKDYGFTNNIQVISEFIMGILKQAEIQIKSRGKGYRSSRTIERVMLDRAIKVLSEVDYNVGSERKSKIDIPETKSAPCVYLASRVGSIDSVKPVLNPHAITQLLNDPNCRTMTSAVEEIISRLKVIKWMIPYYEGDIVESLIYPYFDENGHIICDWSKINPRSETQLEAKILMTKTDNKEVLGRLVVKGVKFESAYKTSIGRD